MMLAKLRMEIEADHSDFGHYQASNMHGILMEILEPAYVEYLHEQKYNPYSQHLEIGEKNYWTVKTMNKTAFDKIILPLMSSEVSLLEIKKKNIKVQIKKKELLTQEKKELLNRFYENESGHFLNLEFLTPTSFKHDGEYVIMPDLRLIYQSLMNKYSASCTDMEMFDEEVLEEMIQNSKIVNYRLNSTYFYLEGVKIPSFRGKLSIKIRSATLARYARFLAEFGEYSGVGIKTSIGMGALKINRKG